MLNDSGKTLLGNYESLSAYLLFLKENRVDHITDFGVVKYVKDKFIIIWRITSVWHFVPLRDFDTILMVTFRSFSKLMLCCILVSLITFDWIAFSNVVE